MKNYDKNGFSYARQNLARVMLLPKDTNNLDLIIAHWEREVSFENMYNKENEQKLKNITAREAHVHSKRCQTKNN